MKPIIISRKEVKQFDAEVFFNARYANKVARLAFDKHTAATLVRINSISGNDYIQDIEVCIGGNWIHSRIAL